MQRIRYSRYFKTTFILIDVVVIAAVFVYFFLRNNDQLFAEIDDLNGGQEAIEERARNELGMIKPGESFYRLVPDQARRNAGIPSSPNNAQ